MIVMEFLYEFLITDLFQCLSSPILVKYKYQDENRHKCKQPKCLGILELVVQVQVLGFKIGKNGAKKVLSLTQLEGIKAHCYPEDSYLLPFINPRWARISFSTFIRTVTMSNSLSEDSRFSTKK